MKQLLSFLLFALSFGLVVSNAQTVEKPCCAGGAKSCGGKTVCCPAQAESPAVEVYYFHATRRCETCKAVEAVTREALKEFYGDKVTLKSINREEESGNPLIGKYKISGQTLLVIKGGKVANLTNDAFLNARTNPDKLKEKIKSTINSLM